MQDTSLLDTTFLNANGLPVHIKDILTEKEYWETKKEKMLIISHGGFEKIAKLAGISLDYKVEESQTVQPSYKNELEHIVRITIQCTFAKMLENGLTIHGHPILFTATGTANRVNTSGVGRKYIRLMAEKRGFDIAVKKYLGLTGRIYSEAESSDFDNTDQTAFYLVPGSAEFEKVSDDITSVITAVDVKSLNAAARVIKKKKQKGEYSFAQENTLKRLYADRFVLLNKPF